MSIPITLTKPLELKQARFLRDHKDITVFEPRERFLAAVVEAIEPRQDLSHRRTLDLFGKVRFSGASDKLLQGCRIHAVSSHSGELFSITIRKPPKKQGTIKWKYRLPEQSWEKLARPFRCASPERGDWQIVWNPSENKVFGATLCDVADILNPLVFDSESANAGLILVAGGTGTGKTSILNGLLLRYLHGRLRQKQERRPHIVAIGDPVETVLNKSKSPRAASFASALLNETEAAYARRAVDFTSRTLGIDVGSVREALRDALRETPAAVIISELRDKDDFQATLEFAETGQLVFATAHSTSLVDAMRKLMSFSKQRESPGGRSLLAQRMKAVIHLRSIDLSGTEASKPWNRMKITLPTLWRHNSSGIRNFVSDGLASILPRSSLSAELNDTPVPPSGDSATADFAPGAAGGHAPRQPGVLGLAWAVEELIRVKEKDKAYDHFLKVKGYLLKLAHTIDLEV